MIRRVREVQFQWPDTRAITDQDTLDWVKRFQAEMDKHIRKMNEVADGVKFLELPVKAAAEIAAYQFWKKGNIVFNSDLGKAQFYDGTTWRIITST